VQGDSYHLIEKTQSPQGLPVRKVIVMNRYEARGTSPQVTAFLLLDDATGKEICSAHITEVREDATTRARLPRRIELRWPAEKLALSMLLDGVTVNAALPQTAFARPRMNGVDSYNLARGRLDSGLQPAQGTAPSASR
jgi:hypothetical protein